MTRVSGGIQSNAASLLREGAASAQTSAAPSVGGQVQQALFGKPRPAILDPAAFPQLAEQLRLLNRYRKKLAVMAGDAEEDYQIVLADGTIAMIDADGIIYVGEGFLAAADNNPDVMVGVLAHEIGHRPKRWNAYRTRRQMSREEMETLCRHEETRADIFAGKALAEMTLSCEPLVELLQSIEERPHPEYLPAKDRARVIRDAHAGRLYRTKARRSLFPDYDRLHGPKGHLGEF